jgi:methionine-rich copper-binding protein CopC
MGGTNGVKDLAGNALANNVVWSFTVLADTTPPTVTSVTPVNGATGVSAATAVTATFSEAINAATLTSTGNFVLRDPANVVVPGTVSYNASTRVGTLAPSTALAASTTYTATIMGGTNGIKDLAGNALASNVVWSFTTALADTTPPTVTSVTPANGAIGVSAAAAVTATFSEAINAATLTSTGNFVLRDPANVVVPGTVSYNAGTRVGTLAPSTALAASTTYTATILGGTNGVKDLAGNALASNVVWSFTTASAITTVGLTTIGSLLDTFDSGYLNGSKVTTSTSGQIMSMSVYIGNIDAAPNRQYQVAIYADNAGAPGTLVAASATGTLVANSWNTIAINASLLAGTNYWLMFNTNGTTGSVNNMYYNNGSAGQGAYSNAPVTFGTWPATFPAATITNSVFSLFATFQ